MHIDGNSCTRVLFLQRLQETSKQIMFLSWKPSSEGGWETLTKLPVGFDPVTAKKTGLQACSNCRARKVKCIWVVGGCERCKSSVRFHNKHSQPYRRASSSSPPPIRHFLSCHTTRTSGPASDLSTTLAGTRVHLRDHNRQYRQEFPTEIERD